MSEQGNNIYPEFDKMPLKEKLIRGIFAYGFEKPSYIQQRAIVPLSEGHDIIAQAQSGTGKTATFTIGTLQRVDTEYDYCQALILAPTRDLALQINNVVSHIGEYMNLKSHACIGGTSVKDSVDEIRKGVHIIVGTPGRVMDMIKRRVIVCDYIKTCVMDEADEMLSKGFKEQIREILNYMPEKCQVGLFSATMPQDVLDLTRNFMNNPLHILVKNDELTLEGIRQYYLNVQKEEWKYDYLCDLYDTINISQSVIFCNTKRKVDQLTRRLIENDFTVSSIHSNMNQLEREQIINDFKTGGSRILITTDLLARGIDVHQVSIVINYDLPHKLETYLHRIGRSGRFGRKGTAINFLTHEDIRTQREIEKFYETQIEELPENIASLI